MGIIRSGPQAFPGNAADWFTLLRTYPLIGLTFLNLFDVVNYALVGLIFLGLCPALFRVNKSAMTLAMALTFVAVAVYFASNQAFALLSLSDQYAVATTDVQRSGLLAAGQALLAIHNSGANYGNGPYVSFLFVNLAGTDQCGCDATKQRVRQVRGVDGDSGEPLRTELLPKLGFCSIDECHPAVCIRSLLVDLVPRGWQKAPPTRLSVFKS